MNAEYSYIPVGISYAHDILTRIWYQFLVTVAGFLVPDFQKQIIVRIKQNKFLNLIIFPVHYYK